MNFESLIMNGKLIKAKKEGFAYFVSENYLLPTLYLPLNGCQLPEYGVVGIVYFDVELVPAVNSYNQPCFYFKAKSIISFEKKK